MSARVVIIGAGITGALTAWRLSRAGYAVTILEARHVGAGSSSRTAAGIRQQFSTPETVMGMRYSVDFFRRFTQEVGGSDSPLVQSGYLFLLGDDRAVEAAAGRVQLQRSCGLDEVELFDAQAAARRFRWLDPSAFAGATWCPSDGFLRPELVYNEAIEAARRLGAVLRQGVEVQEARHREGRLVAVRAGADWVEAEVFIDATNAWSPRLARILGGVELPISPLKRYLWFLDRGAQVSADLLASLPLIIAPGGAYCRPENAHSLLLGYAHDTPAEPEFQHEDQDRIDPLAFHRGAEDGLAVQAWLSMAEVVPTLADLAGFRATTSGYYGTTPDHNPFLGHDPQVENLIRLVGFSGHGAMFGPFSSAIGLALVEAGADLADLPVLDRSVSMLPFRLDRQFRHGEAMVI